MPDNKKIEFSTSADTKGLDQITERLKKLGQVADDIAARFRKLTLGSSGRSDDLSNVVKSTTTEMGKLRLESMKTAETMSDRLGRAVLNNTQQIRQQTREFQHAARAARDLGGTTIQTASQIGRMMGMGAGTTSATGAAMGAMAGGGGGYGSYSGGGRGGGGPIPPGMNFSPYAQRPPNPWMQVPTFQAGLNAAQSTLGAAGGVADLTGRYGQYETGTAMMGLTNLAKAQSYRQDIYRLSANAPVGYGAYLQGRATAYSTGKSNSTQNLLMEGVASGDASRIGRDKATTGASAIDEMASTIMKGRATKQAAELSSTAITATGKVLDAVGNVVKLNISKAGGDIKGAIGTSFDAAELSKSVATGGLSADRAQAQSSVLATLQQIAGPQAQAAFGALQGYAPLLATSARMNAGMGRQAMAMGAGAGYDVGSSSATLASLGQHFGTRAAMSLGPQAFAMSRKGMDAGVAGGIMGQIGMGGGDGGATLERIFAKGVREGMDSLDMRFFEKIGGAIAESAITTSGEVSGGNLPEALMFGLRKGSTMADVQANIAGRGFVDQTLTQNPFFSSRSMSLAASALGSKASGLKTQALTETGINDLMADKNAYLDALGIDKATRQKFARDRLEMMGASMAAGAGFGENAESKRIREGIEKHGSFQKYLEKGGEGTTQFVGAVAKAMGLTNDYKTAVGGMNYIAGTGAEAGTTGGKSVLKDVVDGQAITNIATQTRIIFKQFENVNDILKQIVDGSNGAVKNLGEAYKKLADETIKNMEATMRVGGETYEGSANAAAAASAAAGGLARVGEVSEQVAASLSKLYGVSAAAAGIKESRPKSTTPNTTQPIYKEIRKVGGR